MATRHCYSGTAIREGLFNDLASFSELEKRISALPTTKERGDAFEVFAEAYIATQKITQAVDVWPDQNIPIEVLRKHKLPDRDLGADGVFSTSTGLLNAYQVKFRTGRTPLTWDELGTFMGLTDQVDQRVLFTNCDDLPAVMNDRSGFYCIRGSDLDRLEERDFEAIREWLETDRVEVRRKEPREHQAEALEAILKGVSANDRATAVMACGTGKTLVALWLAEKTAHKRIIVLVPSLALIRQTLHEWLRETSWENPQFLCVCSDKSVAKGADDIIVQQSELDFPVTTDAAEAREFLSRDANDVQVVFTTYQSSRVVGEAMEGLPAFDLGVFDEAHKTAGRESTNFAFALRDDNLRIGKRVFLTATPRHYDVRNKDKEGDLKTVFSMDDEDTYGPIVYTLPFAEAARRGIICDYKVIISVVTSEMINDDLLRHGEVVVDGEVVNARQVAHQIALQRACEEHGLRKVFTFHSTVKAAREFTGDGSSSISIHLPDYRTDSVSGDMPTAKRERVMTAFKEADRAVLSNARCLTEGVDVPAVDMVAFMSPKKSKVDIVQATGRAMRKAEGKDIGYVMVPLYVEMAAGEEIEEALERTDFADVWDLLQAMREQDDVLNDIIRELKVEKGRKGIVDGVRIRERIEVLGPEVSLARLRKSISTLLVERLGIGWDEWFGRLLDYRENYGDCNVPKGYAFNPNLFYWINNQRQHYRKGILHQSRIKRLDDLGFEWHLYSAYWQKMYHQLVNYKKEHGDCDVPGKYPKNQKLSNWVKNTRKEYLNNKISAEGLEKLDKIGFIWSKLEFEWKQMLNEYVSYSKSVKNGGAEPFISKKLAKWIGNQRIAYRQNKLSSGRIQLLNEAGFDWEPWDAKWEKMFEALLSYREEHGHCNVPGRFAANPQLGRWVGTQRTLHLKGQLSDEKFDRLKEIGFVWERHHSLWENMFAEFVIQTENGHSRRPSDRSALTNWINAQRKAYRQNTLSSDRIERLDKAGFIWDPYQAQWEKMYEALLSYRNEHGHCNVPRIFSQNPKLGSWVGTQRAAYKARKLSQNHIKRLENIGFEWSVSRKTRSP